ncbi:MAG TPA: inositol monophosphatase family protein [Actinomycetota bacterium]|nr:inositol monophosphatase family protein [Actinomycetota bacterium]
MDELTLALELAEIADEISMKYFSRNPESSIKKDGSLVTVADREVEEAIRRRIREEFPDHSILGEESGLEGSPDAPIWIVDPIDGTNNYAAGIPVFGTLIGLRVDGRTEVGVASAPALAERYDAATGDGARMNGKPISVSNVDSLSDAVVCIGSYRRMARYGFAKQLEGILKVCRRDRGFGDFWGYMLVARGAAEVMLEPNLNIWDIAPLEVIVREAGGRASGFAGQPYPESRISSKVDNASFLCTNGLLHDELVARLST